MLGGENDSDEPTRDPFDVLLSDIGLPDGSGWDLMRQMRVRYPRLRGIAFSGYGMDADVRSSQAAGFELHLIKPTGVQEIEEAIQLVMTR